MNSSNTAPLIELQQVNQSFRLNSGQKIRALRHVSFSLLPHEILVLLGPSGSGKSTCIRMAAGLLTPEKGLVLSRGKPIPHPNPDVAMVFQYAALLPWLTVFENVAVGLSSFKVSGKLSREQIHQRVEHAVRLRGLAGFENAYPRELSGGMKQRVGIARALVMERAVLCLDESFAALDVLMAESLRREVVDLWLSNQSAIESILMITHDIHEAVLLGTRIIVLSSDPGEVLVTIKNNIPYPRDERSAAFKHLAQDLHDVITQTIIPDTPEWVPPAFKMTQVSSIPPAYPSEVSTLIDIISEQKGRANTFEVSERLRQDSIKILFLAKAAEILNLVDTPGNDIVLTELGKNFANGDIAIRQRIIHEQLRALPLIHLLRRNLRNKSDHLLATVEVMRFIAQILPNENPEQVLETLIQWGRYGEVLSYDDERKVVGLA